MCSVILLFESMLTICVNSSYYFYSKSSIFSEIFPIIVLSVMLFTVIIINWSLWFMAIVTLLFLSSKIAKSINFDSSDTNE